MRKKTIAVDFDGVLSIYTKWKGIEHQGEPIEGAREFLNVLTSKGYNVLIYTCRCTEWLNEREGYTIDKLRELVHNWLIHHDMYFDDIYVGQGKPPAFAYVDDRAINCRPQKHGVFAFTNVITELDNMEAGF